MRREDLGNTVEHCQKRNRKEVIMIKKLLMAAFTTGLVAKGVQMLLQRADERTKVQKKRERKSETQRWENEGGPAA
jgi:hypothetical protein